MAAMGAWVHLSSAHFIVAICMTPCSAMDPWTHKYCTHAPMCTKVHLEHIEEKKKSNKYRAHARTMQSWSCRLTIRGKYAHASTVIDAAFM